MNNIEWVMYDDDRLRRKTEWSALLLYRNKTGYTLTAWHDTIFVKNSFTLDDDPDTFSQPFS